MLMTSGTNGPCGIAMNGTPGATIERAKKSWGRSIASAAFHVAGALIYLLLILVVISMTVFGFPGLKVSLRFR